MNNVCPKTNLEKHWKRLRMTTTVDGQVSVRAIAKTFASGKTEKLVYQTLAECGLPNGKVNINILIAIGLGHCFTPWEAPLRSISSVRYVGRNFCGVPISPYEL